MSHFSSNCKQCVQGCPAHCIYAEFNKYPGDIHSRKTKPSWWKPSGTSLLPSSCCSAYNSKWFPIELVLWCCRSHAAHGRCRFNWTPVGTIESFFHIPLHCFFGWFSSHFFCLPNLFWKRFGYYWPTTWMWYFGLRVKHSRCQKVCRIHK